MKRRMLASAVVAILSGAVFLAAQDADRKPAQGEAMEMPGPVKEHEWLRQFVGEWEADVEMYMVPGEPPQKATATESTRSIGGFWILAENRGTFLDQPFTGILTLGYDPQKKKYVGSWVDSMTSYLWNYEGTVDAAGKVLTLDTEGPCPHAPGELSRFKEVVEFQGRDHKVFTSSIQGEDGEWVKMMTINYRRKK